MGLCVDELEISTATNEEISSKIQKNDFIYATGGNAFFLLQELQRTGADKIIVEAINTGKLYIGESAGSVITSPNIEYVKQMDSIEKAPHLKYFDALCLVDFYTVPHYTNAPFKKVVEKIIDFYSQRVNLFPISNNDAICVENDTVTIRKNAKTETLPDHS